MTEEDTRDLALAAGGDRVAFERFVARHAPAVMRLLLAIARSPEDAEDALQETFVSAWRSAGRFEGRGSARGWILAIARNAMRKLYRKRAAEPDEEASLEALDLDALGLAAGWGRDESERAREALESRDALEAALARLSPAEREVIVLRDLEGLDGESTARILGITLEATKSRLHRARLRLAALLQEAIDAPR